MLSHLLALLSACLASFCASLGFIMMKIANIKVENQPNKYAFLQKEFIFGLVLLLVQVACNGFALNLAGVILIACTSSITIFFNIILSALILGEKVKCNPDGLVLLFISIGGSIAGS